MIKFAVLSFFVGVFLSLNAVALTADQRRSVRCEYLFVSPETTSALRDLPDYQTVRIAGRHAGYHGQEFYRLRKLRPSYPWGSRFATRSFDPQGDPSRSLVTFGPDLARVIGLRPDAATGDILAPTPETLNRRIARFNRFLIENHIEPIPVSFYSQQKPKIELFLRQWSQSARIPVAADDSTHTIHDITFHYSAILLPVQIVNLLKIQAGIAWQWLRTEESKVLTEVALEAVHRIDHISASANHGPGAPYLLRFWEHIYAEDDDNGRLRARPVTHTSLFFESLQYHNRVRHDAEVEDVFPDLRQRTSPFFEGLKDIDSQWNRKIETLGLLDIATVREMYIVRAIELRHAARLFWAEQDALKRNEPSLP
jgi:hypothetical protein